MTLRRVIALLIGTPLVVLGLVGPASAAVLAESTFDSDVDGWQATNIVGFTFVTIPVSFAAGAGNPGGAISLAAPPGSPASFFLAPAKFITALPSAIGGSIQWDVSTQPVEGHGFFAVTDILIATGPLSFASQNTIFTEVTPPPPPTAPDYAEYEMTFLEGNWSFSDGPFRTPELATQAQIDDVLANATFLIIRAEYHEPPAAAPTETPGADIAFLDNVRILNGAAPVPEPSTLLLLATGGLAAIGVARRRRWRDTQS